MTTPRIPRPDPLKWVRVDISSTEAFLRTVYAARTWPDSVRFSTLRTYIQTEVLEKLVFMHDEDFPGWIKDLGDTRKISAGEKRLRIKKYQSEALKEMRNN